MGRHHSAKPFLVALSEGLPPYAENMVCDDLRGPESLFGEGVKTPKPLRFFSLKCGGDGESPSGSKLQGQNCRCAVLWESEECRTPGEFAESLIRENDIDYGGDRISPSLRVPAPTFLAGQSTSSFSVAWELTGRGAFPEWSSVICSCQTEGRGQLRREWHSPRGNLYVTFRLPDDPAFREDAASVLVGYLVVRAFRSMGFPLSLKWPNDLILEGSVKAGGILLEERNGVLLAGLGVNLMEAPPTHMLRDGYVMRAGRLMPHHACTAKPLDDDTHLAPYPLWKQLVAGMILEYNNSIARYGQPFVIDALNSESGEALSTPVPDMGKQRNTPGENGETPLLTWKGQRVLLSEGEGVHGRMMGVGPGGGLLLRLPGGSEHEFFSGSLSLDS